MEQRSAARSAASLPMARALFALLFAPAACVRAYGEADVLMQFSSSLSMWEETPILGLTHTDVDVVIEDGDSESAQQALRVSTDIYIAIEDGDAEGARRARQIFGNSQSGDYYGKVMAVLTIGLFALTAATLALPLPPWAVAYVVCTFYVVVSVTIDLSIAMQKNGGSSEVPYLFNPKCAVLLTELIKLVVSVGLGMAHGLSGSSNPIAVCFDDVKWLLLPAALFTANNILVYQAIGKNDMSAFGVFRDTMILWTAAIWRCVFGTPLGSARLGGIFIIFVGLTLNRAGMSSWSWAFLWVLLMTLTNSLASVANEFALKSNQGLDINIQNTVLYSACLLFAIGLLAVDEPARLTSPSTFFSGFTSSTMLTVCLQAFAGLIVSRLLKYADSVTKTVASCLRGPIVVLTAPYLLSKGNNWSDVMSAFVVASGCVIYLLCGPLSKPAYAPQSKDIAAGAISTKSGDARAVAK